MNNQNEEFDPNYGQKQFDKILCEFRKKEKTVNIIFCSFIALAFFFGLFLVLVQHLTGWWIF